VAGSAVSVSQSTKNKELLTETKKQSPNTGARANNRHKATHRHGGDTSQHHHRGQQILRHEVTQVLGALNSKVVTTSSMRNSFVSHAYLYSGAGE